MTVVFTQKSLLYCPSFNFPESWGLLSECEHSIWARNPVSKVNLRTKNALWRRWSQKLSNIIAMTVDFTPKRLLFCPSFNIPECCGLFSVWEHTIWAHNPFSNFNLLTKNAVWRQWSPKVEQFYCHGRSFYSKKSVLLSQFHFSRVLWPAFRARALDLGLKSFFQIQFTHQNAISRRWSTKVEPLFCDGRSFYPKKSVVFSQFLFSRVLWPAFRVRAFVLGPTSVFLFQLTHQKRN